MSMEKSADLIRHILQEGERRGLTIKEMRFVANNLRNSIEESTAIETDNREFIAHF